MKSFVTRRFGFAAALAALIGTASSVAAGPYPTLDKLKAGPGRFKAVLGGAGILDKETGIVWEKAPSTQLRTWGDANYHCYTRLAGNRGGWRLPAIEEVFSLFEGSGSGGAQLPLGHPFQNLTADYVWTNSRVASPGSEYVYAVGPTDGDIAYEATLSSIFDTQAWCVRAGRGHNPSDFEPPTP